MGGYAFSPKLPGGHHHRRHGKLSETLPVGRGVMWNIIPSVFAATLPTDTSGKASGVATIQSLETLFTNVVNVVIALSGVALLLMFIVGGFSFMFAAGDAKKMEQARATITNAIIGLIIIVAAYLILKIISVFTGLPDILKFSIPTG